MLSVSWPMVYVGWSLAWVASQYFGKCHTLLYTFVNMFMFKPTMYIAHRCQYVVIICEFWSIGQWTLDCYIENLFIPIWY